MKAHSTQMVVEPATYIPIELRVWCGHVCFDTSFLTAAGLLSLWHMSPKIQFTYLTVTVHTVLTVLLWSEEAQTTFDMKDRLINS